MTQNSSQKTPKDREAELVELGKKLQAFYDSGYVNRKQALVFSFLKGIATGLGSVVGATLAVALLLWILSGLDQVPFVGHLSESIRNTLRRQP